MRWCLVLLATALASCTSAAPTARSRCIAARVGPAGGTLQGDTGTVVIPAGALASDTNVSLCVVEVGQVPGQFSDMVELSPIDAVLSARVSVTIPIAPRSPASLVAEVRATPTGALLAAFPARRDPIESVATFDVDRFGDIRILESTFVSTDGGLVDANRPDAEIPVGPVVVGRDLVPADYACLGRDPTPSTGPARPIRVHVVDWADHGARQDYAVHAASEGDWNGTAACDAHPDCVGGTTDAAGDVTLALAPGPVFFVISDATRGQMDASRVPAMQWVVGVQNAATDTVVDLQAISLRTSTTLNGATGFPGVWALGTLRDCAGGAVQRARLRGFDASGTEVLSSPFGTSPVTYGNGLGFPGGSATRTTIDGVFLYLPPGTDGGRLEAWGHLSIDGPEVLLSCEPISFLQGGVGPTRIDLRPLRSDAPSDCGSRP